VHAGRDQMLDQGGHDIDHDLPSWLIGETR
jgi:hypothetical protein